MAALSVREGADCLVCTRIFFSFVTCWHFTTSALLILFIVDPRKTVDYQQGSRHFSQYAKNIYLRVTPDIGAKTCLNIQKKPRPTLACMNWNSSRGSKEMPRNLYLYGVMKTLLWGPFMRFPWGTSTQISLVLWSSFQVLSQLKWSVSCDCAINRGS